MQNTCFKKLIILVNSIMSVKVINQPNNELGNSANSSYVG